MKRQVYQEAAAVWVAIADLHPWDRNPRLNEPAVAKVAESIKRFGFGSPILARPNGELIAGHTRLKAALKLGLDRVPVRYLDLDPADARLLALADNKLGEIAEWDEALLAEVLREFDPADAAIAGFGADELANLIAKLDPSEPEATHTEPDDLPAAMDEAVTKPGDLWILGQHRLLCADSTDASAVKRLLAGKRTDAAITSPPYSDLREYGIGKFDWLALMNGAFDQMAAHLAPEGHILVNLGPSHKDRRVDRYWDPWLDHAESHGWPLYGWYVWDKGWGMPGAWNGRLAPVHEWVFHFTRSGKSANKWIPTTSYGATSYPTGSGKFVTEVDGLMEKQRRPAPKKRKPEDSFFRQKDGTTKMSGSLDTIGQDFKVPDSIIRINREAARGEHTAVHPAVFPVDFAEFLIETWTQQGQIVHEPFGGSGTTIVACERTGRVCCAMEIEPRYCDVAIERWQRLTGQRARLGEGE